MTNINPHPPQLKISATYMRGGTSKGVFFKLDDLPKAIQQPCAERDDLLLRVIGSPDPYKKHTDGMGGATSSTSKVVILSRSEHLGHDIDYLFGQVAIDKPVIDWSGNCGNLTAAVGAFAITNGLVDPKNIPDNGIATVRVWQKNIEKTILVHVPITNKQVQETGDFVLDGVAFPAAEVQVDFIDPTDGKLFPTGELVDTLYVPGAGQVSATMINAGIPTIFVNAKDIGFTGSELQPDINSQPKHLELLELIRAHGALKMGLIDSLEGAASRQHTPKIAFVAPPTSYTASSGQQVLADDIDLNVRAVSMGQLHHAMMGTAAVAIAIAAVVPGTLVNLAAGGGAKDQIVFGHPSGTLKVGAKATQHDGLWLAEKASMSRSARTLMQGAVFVPAG